MRLTEGALPGGARALTRRALRLRVFSVLGTAVALFFVGTVVAAVPAAATPAPRLRGLLKQAHVVVAAAVTSVTSYDDDRVAVVTLAVDQVFKGTLPSGPPAQVALVEMHEGPVRPALTVGARGIAFLRPAARISYLAKVLPAGTYYELLPEFGAFVPAGSKADAERQIAVLTQLVAAARGERMDASAARRQTFDLLGCESAVLVEDGAAGVADLGAQRALTPEELSTLRTALQRSDLPDRVRIALIQAVGRGGVTEAVPTLQGIDAPPAVAEAAWQALDQLGAPPPEKSLTARLANPAPSVRAAAVRELLRRDGVAAVSQVAPVAVQDPDPAVRRAAVDALGGLKKPEALPPLERVFSDSSGELQQATGRAILAVGGPPAVDAFGRLAFDGPLGSQRYAVVMLMIIDDPHKAEVLRRIRETHPDEGVRTLIDRGFPAPEH